MTIPQQVRLITQILQEDGEGENDERVLEEKIRLLESIIQDPKRYKEFDKLAKYARYTELLRVAKEINYEDAKTIEEWKIPIERKIEASQEKLRNTAPSMLEEALIKEKRNIYISFIGREEARKIQGKGKNLEAEVEELRKAAIEVNPTAVEMLDGWDLSEEQRDYIFVQDMLNSILNGNLNDISYEKITRLKAIRDKMDDDTNGQIKDSDIKAEMRKLLKSSSLYFVFEMVERKKEKEAKDQEMGEK